MDWIGSWDLTSCPPPTTVPATRLLRSTRIPLATRFLVPTGLTFPAILLNFLICALPSIPILRFLIHILAHVYVQQLNASTSRKATTTSNLSKPNTRVVELKRLPYNLSMVVPLKVVPGSRRTADYLDEEL